MSGGHERFQPFATPNARLPIDMADGLLDAVQSLFPSSDHTVRPFFFAGEAPQPFEFREDMVESVDLQRHDFGWMGHLSNGGCDFWMGSCADGAEVLG
jgi:hypothetical protein